MDRFFVALAVNAGRYCLDQRDYKTRHIIQPLIVRHFYFLYFHLVATKQEGIRSFAVRACLPMGDGLIFLPAVLAPGHRGYKVDLQLASGKHRLLPHGPFPAVDQIFRDYGRNFPDIHNYCRDAVDVVLDGGLLDILDDVEDYSQFMHRLLLLEEDLPGTLEHIRKDSAELVLGCDHIAGLRVHTMQVNGIEAALGGAYSATDALVLIDH